MVINDQSHTQSLSLLPAAPGPVGFTQESFSPVCVCRAAGRQKDVVRGTRLSAVLQNGHDAGREMGSRWSPFSLLPLQRLAHILGVCSKTLGGGHHPVDVNGKAFGARGTWGTGGD